MTDPAPMNGNEELPTPRTDKIHRECHERGQPGVPTGFARQLERENEKLRELLSRIAEWSREYHWPELEGDVWFEAEINKALTQ
jgi:hypothetical protein